MKLEGSYTLRAPRERVWALLTDPASLARSLPGCDKLTQTAENTYEMALKVGVAAVSGNYSGTVALSEVQPPAHLRLTVSGRGSPGFLTGDGTLDLEERGEETLVRYRGEAHVGGMIASVGQRMLEGAARLILSQFFQNLTRQLTTPAG